MSKVAILKSKIIAAYQTKIGWNKRNLNKQTWMSGRWFLNGKDDRKKADYSLGKDLECFFSEIKSCEKLYAEMPEMNF